jgi:predicted kinase
MRFLLQMAGMPGSGKTAIAQAVGHCTGAVVIDKDLIMAGAMNAGVPGATAGAAAYEVGFELAASFLRAGHSVILDSPANFVAIRERGSGLASDVGVAYFVIECAVSRHLSEERLKAREPVHALHPSSLHGIDTGFERAGTAPLSEPHLQLDSSRPIEINVARALEYIGHGQG